MTILTYPRGTIPKTSRTGPGMKEKGAAGTTKPSKAASFLSSTARVPQRKRPGRKEALVDAITSDLQDLTVEELRLFKKRLVEARRLGRMSDSAITAYLPDTIVGNGAVELKLDDGSTWIVRVAARRRGEFVIFDATRSATAPTLSKPGADAVVEVGHPALDRARAEYESVRDSVVKQSLSLTRAAKRMNLTTEGLSARVDRGEMLAFVEHNRKMVPVALIDDDQPDRTVCGLPEVIRAAGMEPFRLAVWLLNPARSLGEARPVDELRAGNVERVVRAARGVEAS